MGQKTHPRGFRVGVTDTWDSRWFAERDYADLLQQDANIRKFLKKRLQHAGVPRVEIERSGSKVKVNIYTARPGIVIGKKGVEIEKLKREIVGIAGSESFVEIHEIRRPDLDAQLVAENIAMQLERRIMFRRARRNLLREPCVWARSVSGCSAAGAWAVTRSRGPSGTARGAFLSTRFAPTSSTDRPRRARRSV